MLAIRPDLVQLDRAGDEDGNQRGKLQGLRDTYTAMWWYADFPNHYAGDGRPATAQKGEIEMEARARGLAEVILSVKEDSVTRKLQDEFFGMAEMLVPARRKQAKRRK